MEIRPNKLILVPAIGFFLIIALFSYTAIADVVSPVALSYSSSSSFDETDYSAQQTNASAGNLTELTIVGISPTKAWQGFYGNISGDIVLQDASGNVFYNWTVTEPKGEIYASPNSSITWTNINCFNFTANASIAINLTTIEDQYNIDRLDEDGIDETFNTTNPETIYVGDTTLEIGSCPATYVFINSDYQYEDFINFLVTDNSSIVFATVLENRETNNNTDKVGYNGQTYDFQLLTAEDGHNGDTTTTPYYFWIEIE